MKKALLKTTVIVTSATFLVISLLSFSWATSEVPKELIKAAQNEGEINWATGILRGVAEPICRKFEQTYGIKANLTRIGTEALMGRFMMEMEARSCKFDLLTTGKPPIGKYKEAGWIKQYLSPRINDMSAEMVEVVFHKPDGWWTPTLQDFQLISYNSKHISEKDAPKSWTDLLDPKFKDKMAHADPRYSGTAMLTVTALADHYGWDYYEKLGKNNLMITRGHGALLQMMIGGERPVAAEMLFFVGGSAAKKGEPIEMVFPTDGAVPTPWQSYISSAAPHPNAARLFLEFLLSEEIQTLAVEKGTLYPVIKGVDNPAGFPKPKDIKVMPVDIYKAEKNKEEIKDTFWSSID
jgi:iron(III) transport system substrate-binding protein